MSHNLLYCLLFTFCSFVGFTQDHKSITIPQLLDMVSNTHLDSLKIKIDTTFFSKTEMVKANITEKLEFCDSLSFYNRVQVFDNSDYYKPTDIILLKCKDEFILFYGFLDKISNQRNGLSLKSVTCFNQKQIPLYSMVFIEDNFKLFVSYELLDSNKLELNYHLPHNMGSINEFTIRKIINFDERLIELNVSPKSVERHKLIHDIVYSRLW